MFECERTCLRKHHACMHAGGSGCHVTDCGDVLRMVDVVHTHQVVQHMFELMDADQMSLAEAHRERKEIEALWKQEKDQRKRTQQVKDDF